MFLEQSVADLSALLWVDRGLNVMSRMITKRFLERQNHGKIRILPVYPEFPLTFWGYQKAVEYIGKKAAMPPTGLATILAMLPEDDFLIHRIIDLNVESLTDQQIQSCDLVFTSSMLVQEESHNEIINRVHSFGKKVVAGGSFPNLVPRKKSPG